MMKYIYIILLSTVLGCREEKPLTLTILNKNLNYVESDSVPYGEMDLNFQVLNSLKARNIVQYQLTNNTEESLLVLFDPYSLNILGDYPLPDTFSDEGLYYAITDGNDNKARIFTANYNAENKDFIKILENKKEIRLLQKNLIKDTIFQESAFSQSYIIHPNETTFFSIELDLPFVKQPSIENNLTFAYFNIFKGSYYYQVFYSISENDAKKRFTEKELRYLEENRIRIFSGRLSSNKIEVRPLR